MSAVEVFTTLCYINVHLLTLLTYYYLLLVLNLFQSLSKSWINQARYASVYRAPGWTTCGISRQMLLKTEMEKSVAKMLSIRPFLCYFYLQKLPKSLSSDAFLEVIFHQKSKIRFGDPAGGIQQRSPGSLSRVGRGTLPPLPLDAFSVSISSPWRLAPQWGPGVLRCVGPSQMVNTDPSSLSIFYAAAKC